MKAAYARTEEDIRTGADNQDLGLGSRITEQTRVRFLNRDGSFNVRRFGVSFFKTLNVYHALLTMSWTGFNLCVVAAYFATNVAFAFSYFMCGPGAIAGSAAATDAGRFLDSFFFSVQTLGTIGYGTLSPVGLPANMLVTAESLVGLLGFALATGMLFARFSRPYARILFSECAVIAPYRGMTAFEFRIINGRTNQLIDITATVSMSRLELVDGVRVRRFHALPLERRKVTFFPLNWTIVHPITESSPLHGVSEKALRDSDPEFLILLSGTDETFSQTVHARSSYKQDEVKWGMKFANMYVSSPDGMVAVDVEKLSAVEEAAIASG